MNLLRLVALYFLTFLFTVSGLSVYVHDNAVIGSLIVCAGITCGCALVTFWISEDTD